jgi:hypothetical protein
MKKTDAKKNVYLIQKIISFLMENEMTDIELDWLRSHGNVSEVEVLKLVGCIMLSRYDG